MSGLAHSCARGWQAVSMLLVMAPACAAAQVEPIPITDEHEILEHIVKPTPGISKPWRDITREDEQYAGWTFELTIDALGAVAAARLKEGVPEMRAEATRIARSLRFKPFVREGRAVPVRFEYLLEAHTADYAGPDDRTFPANPDPATTVIALSRTICMGSCPAYRVELRGNGDVYYEGHQRVVVRGPHRWHVDPASLAPLFELLRRASYFELGGYYDNEFTDQPAFTTRVSIGDRHKFVYDYCGGNENFPMPEIVSEIEDAIDKVSQSEAYVSGNASTMQRLRDERWNFRSRDAGRGLRMLTSACKTELAREFVRAGAPVDVVDEEEDEAPALSAAANCGDVELARALIAAGALRHRNDADLFMWWSAGTGQPGMVALALPHYRNINLQDGYGDTVLGAAARSSPPDDDEPGVATFDPVKVVEMLIDAGADPNSRNKEGETPLFKSGDDNITATLLRRGADPHARDNRGRTALFDRYSVGKKRLLIAAGTDVNVRDQSGQTALFYQNSPEAIVLLLAAGADANATDLKGKTAIEQLNSPLAFQALLAAGAKLPTETARLDAMIADATRHGMTEVLPVLEAAKAK